MSPKEPGSFSPDLFRFLRELAKNNTKAWFEANKPRYEASVLGPAVEFVATVGPQLAQRTPHVAFAAKPHGGSVSRIYRDTRFSKDKSPYRTNVGIHFGHERSGSDGEHLPGFYLHLAPGESTAHSGVWHPETVALGRIRDTIVADPGGWAKVRTTSAPAGGESYARVPKGFDPDHRFAEDLRRKDFFASIEFKDAEVSSPQFPARFLAACGTLDPLNRFLAHAMGVPW